MGIPPGPAFYSALAQRESGNDPTIVNSWGFMGLYQMGPSALQDIGYMDGNGRWLGGNGRPSSQAEFLNSRAIQDQAIRQYHILLWSRIPQDVKNAVGSRVGRVNKVTESGLLAGAHLRGPGGVIDYIRSGGQIDDKDEIGTPCSDYIIQFGGYD